MNTRNLHINSDLSFLLKQKQKQIGEYLLNVNPDYTNNLGTMDGIASLGLVFSLYYKYTFDERFFDKLGQTIETINKKIQTAKDISSSYAGGIAGYAWLIAYLKENDLIEIDMDDYLSDIDDFLFRNLIQMIKIKEYDPLHHAVGLGFYFVKRGNIEAIENIIDGLYNDRKNISGSNVWITNNKRINKDTINFGVAHGIPGILLFLHKCWQKQISSQKCREMIEDNISFIFRHLNHSGTPSYFPSCIEIDQIMQFDSKQNHSRLAWCYGDLGTFYAIFHISLDFSVNIDVIRMLERVAQRKNYNETDVSDAGFCHGTSGIAHIFHRLFLKTGNLCFEEASIYWLKRTLLMGNYQEGVAGYKFPENHNNPPLDLLTGLSGVGTVIISVLNPELIQWDESIFLS